MNYILIVVMHVQYVQFLKLDGQIDRQAQMDDEAKCLLACNKDKILQTLSQSLRITVFNLLPVL